MSGVNLAEVLLDEMVILDCEPFKDKENMFDVMTAKFEEAGFVSDAKAYKDALEYRESLGPTYMGKLRCNTSWKMQRSSETRNWIL